MKRIWERLRAAVPAPAALAVAAAFALMLIAGGGGRESGGNTGLEARVSRALSQIAGAERVEVVIRTKTLEVQGSGFSAGGTAQEIPCGAIAVVEGAQDPYLRVQVAQALCALLGLQAAQVDVLSAAGGMD